AARRTPRRTGRWQRPRSRPRASSNVSWCASPFSHASWGWISARHAKSSDRESQTVFRERSPQAGSGHGFDDVPVEPRERIHVLAALAPQALDDTPVLVDTALPGVQLAGAEQALVVPLDPRDARCDLVAEVGIAIP